MVIEHYDKWKDIPIDLVCRKRGSISDEERLLWYKEWRTVHICIINKLGNYLNKKDIDWDKNLDDKTITTEQLIAHMKNRLEALGVDRDAQVELVAEGNRR